MSDGSTGYCAAAYLEAVAEAPQWHAPIREDKFKVTQKFLNPNKKNYPVTGVHSGTDYGTQGLDGVPLYFCADGEVIETGVDHKFFGNYFFYYVPEVDRTFAYFHLRDSLPKKGKYKGGEICGIAGNTGFSHGIHLHMECIKGRKTSADRSKFCASKTALISAMEDSDKFIRERLQ